MYKLYIDTGNQQNDNYLTGLNYQMKFWTFTRDYSSFTPNTNINFSEVQETDSGNGPSFVPTIINKISFYKTFNDVSSIIEYNDIPVANQGRHDDWGFDGNNNI